MTIDEMKQLKEGDKIRLIRDVNLDGEAYRGLRGKYESLVKKGREYVFDSISAFGSKGRIYTKTFRLRDIDPALADVEPKEGNLTLLLEDIELVVKKDYKKDGLCPACGDRGEWRMLALFCRAGHGRFAG